MTDVVLNYVHKIQGLDKCLPVCAELKRRRRVLVITIIDLEDTAEQQDCESFGPLIHLCSDVVLEPRTMSPTPWSVVDCVSRCRGDTDSWRLKRLLRCIDRHVRALDGGPRSYLLLTIFNGVKRRIGERLSEYVKAKGGRRLGYLKSLHDQGRGLSDVRATLAANSAIHVAPHLDALLVPDHDDFRRLMERLGVGMPMQIVAGYPICYPHWKRIVQALPVCRGFRDTRREFEVVLFTRGEVAHKAPAAQTISDEWLTRALIDIIEELRATGKDVRLRIKPHPYQDISLLQSFVDATPEACLTDWPPVMLAATADVAIATYSSAILDAVAMGVPAVEYFSETDAFRRLHPDGSPFGAFGVVITRSRSDLRRAIEAVTSGTAARFDLGQALGDTLDQRALDDLFGVGRATSANVSRWRFRASRDGASDGHCSA